MDYLHIPIFNLKAYEYHKLKVGNRKTKDTLEVTTVTLEMEPTAVVLNCMEHSGISNDAGDTSAAMFESFNGDWDSSSLDLSDYLDTSKI